MSRSSHILTLPQERSTAAVFASPHSGCEYSWEFIRESALDEHTIRSSEDAFVDMLYEAAPQFGAPLLTASVPRAFVDLNRSADELDPALIAGARQTGHNPRISSGLGVIPRVVANAREIRQGKISMAEAQRRLDDYYHPYHNCLRGLMDDGHAMFGQAVLFDCHSMPHDALSATSYAFDQKPDVVLGDRFGAGAAPELMEQVDKAFRSAGFRTSRNLPFAGAYVVQTYGKPVLGHHAIQIEIDRSLYMNETTIETRPDFEEFRSVLNGIIAQLAEICRADLRVAAE